MSDDERVIVEWLGREHEAIHKLIFTRIEQLENVDSLGEWQAETRFIADEWCRAAELARVAMVIRRGGHREP